MNKIKLFLLGVVFLSIGGCKKYLDVNKNPNGPSTADPALYLPAIQHGFAVGVQFDSRGLGPYTQNFLNSTAASAWDLHGYTRSSDFGGEVWRNVYWKAGQNLLDMMAAATAQKKWDILGAGQAMQAWGWQTLTDMHGPIILKQAFDPSRNTFDYDEQDTVYAYTERLLKEAIANLNRQEDGVGSKLFTNFDMIYKGDRVKWKKFAYALLAINEHHKIKKAGYDADQVIAYVDSSFTGNADDALVPFNGSNSTDANFYGPLRGNMGIFGQSAFIVRLTDGSIFNGVKDPRQPIMLNPSTDGVYRGLAAGAGQSTAVSGSASGVRSLWGTTLGTNTVPSTTPGKYLFMNKAPFPLMTYAQMQFIKAEAAFFKGDKGTALIAYKNGINAHLDFVRNGATAPGSNPGGGTFAFNTDGTVTAAFDAQKALFLADPNIIPTTATNLTLSMIMLQKYIALWGYGFVETWTDLRKFDYSSTVFTSFALPSGLFPDNSGKLAYRVRPRYNSEYVWNIDALTKIGGFELDYHTKKLWIHE